VVAAVACAVVVGAGVVFEAALVAALVVLPELGELLQAEAIKPIANAAAATG
jgi:hypothetical protein